MNLEDDIETDFFQAAIDAATIHEKVYGYPTLVCGNFVTSIQPATKEVCPITTHDTGFPSDKTALTTCKEHFLDDSSSQYHYDTLLVGKMSDEDGWYLPYIYLDGYIDKHSSSESVNIALNELEAGIVDAEVCENLKWFISLCQNSKTGENLCTGGLSTDEIENHIANYTSVLMFSFSEKLASLLKHTNYNREAQALTSVSLGMSNQLLQFTDGLVVSRQLWQHMREDKRNAIKQFMRFFSGLSFRKKVTLGDDLIDRQTPRYLLIPNKTFYKQRKYLIYKDAHRFLENAVPAPPLSEEKRKSIQRLLENICIQEDKVQGKIKHQDEL